MDLGIVAFTVEIGAANGARRAAAHRIEPIQSGKFIPHVDEKPAPLSIAITGGAHCARRGRETVRRQSLRAEHRRRRIHSGDGAADRRRNPDRRRPTVRDGVRHPAIGRAVDDLGNRRVVPRCWRQRLFRCGRGASPRVFPRPCGATPAAPDAKGNRAIEIEGDEKRAERHQAVRARDAPGQRGHGNPHHRTRFETGGQAGGATGRSCPAVRYQDGARSAPQGAHRQCRRPAARPFRHCDRSVSISRRTPSISSGWRGVRGAGGRPPGPAAVRSARRIATVAARAIDCRPMPAVAEPPAR